MTLRPAETSLAWDVQSPQSRLALRNMYYMIARLCVARVNQLVQRKLFQAVLSQLPLSRTLCRRCKCPLVDFTLHD